MMRAWAGLFAAAWLGLCQPVAAAEVAVPRLEARVTDRTGTLDADNRQRLEILLAGIERDRGAQVAVLLLPTTQPETIEQFGIRLAEAWKIGRKGADNGVIIIVAKNDRKMRIEVGYGLEGAIPDAVAKRIVAERMAPRFKQGDFAGGLIDAAEAIEQAIAGPAAGNATPAPAGTSTGIPVVSPDGMGGEHPDWMTWLFLLVVGAGVLRLILGMAGSLLAAGVGGWLGFMVFGSLLGAGGAALLIFLLSFVNLLSGGGGGGGGGFSSSSSSDSGFSGGGGSFGGGGASGDW